MRRTRFALALAARVWLASDPVEAGSKELHDCMADGRWMTPPEHNVRAVLDRLAREHPGDARVRALRVEAGERLLG